MMHKPIVDLDALRAFIATMNGDKAEISKTSLVAIERELSAGRVPRAEYVCCGIDVSTKPDRQGAQR